jgi:hypothetical protein
MVKVSSGPVTILVDETANKPHFFDYAESADRYVPYRMHPNTEAIF